EKKYSCQRLKEGHKPAQSRRTFVEPSLQALVVADHVYSEKATGKKIIAGTFNRIFVGKLDPKMEQYPEDMKFAASTAAPIGKTKGTVCRSNNRVQGTLARNTPAIESSISDVATEPPHKALKLRRSPATARTMAPALTQSTRQPTYCNS